MTMQPAYCHQDGLELPYVVQMLLSVVRIEQRAADVLDEVSHGLLPVAAAFCLNLQLFVFLL